MTPEQLFRARISRALGNVRRQRRMNQTQFGRLLGKHRNTVMRWENGEGYIELWDWVMIAHALDVRLSDLLAEILELPAPVKSEAVELAGKVAA